MTDAEVARKLGWRKVHAKRQWGGKPCRVWERGEFELSKLPAYTTSLDAIVAEVRSHGPKCLEWVAQFIANECELANSLKAFADPKAWCRGLLAHLKADGKGADRG